MADWWFKRGDTEPPIRQQLLDGNGTPVNLEDSTVTFVMRAIDGVTKVYEAATIEQTGDADDPDNATVGWVRHDWSADDLDTPGGYYAEWQVDFAGGTPPRETFPNDRHVTVAVIADLGQSEGS